jgi:hypothetical protein
MTGKVMMGRGRIFRETSEEKHIAVFEQTGGSLLACIRTEEKIRKSEIWGYDK